MFIDKLFPDEDIADMSVSDNEDLPVSALQVSRMWGASGPPDIDRIVRINNNELALMDRRIGEVSGLSMEICDPLIHSNILDSRISQGDTEWLCLLYSASSGNVRDDTIAIRLHDKGLDHWRGVVWDPGIVMLLVRDWAAWSLWTRTESGYCRTITWELGYWRSIHPSCVVQT